MPYGNSMFIHTTEHRGTADHSFGVPIKCAHSACGALVVQYLRVGKMPSRIRTSWSGHDRTDHYLMGKTVSLTLIDYLRLS